MDWRERDKNQRVVITGMGAITPMGLDVDQYWNSLISGTSGIDFVTTFDASEFPCVVAGEITDFDPPPP